MCVFLQVKLYRHANMKICASPQVAYVHLDTFCVFMPVEVCMQCLCVSLLIRVSRLGNI